MEKNDDGSPFDLVEERVKTILIKQLRWGVKEITSDSTFEKLGIDSLDRVELMIALEDDFNIEITDAEADDLVTVRDAVALIKVKVIGEMLDFAPAQPIMITNNTKKQMKLCKSCGCLLGEEIKISHDEHECALAMKEAKEMENEELRHVIHLFDKKVRAIAELLGVCYAGVDTDHDSIILAIKNLQVIGCWKREMKKENIERNCTECAYEHGTGTCYRVTAPHSSQWLNENGDCKEYIKRYSLRHLWYWCNDKRL